MTFNLLMIYEIADKAAKVNTRQAFREFEKWVLGVVADCRDIAVQRAASIQLFRLRDQFA